MGVRRRHAQNKLIDLSFLCRLFHQSVSAIPGDTSLRMAYFNNPCFLLSLAVFLLETRFVKLAEVGYPLDQTNLNFQLTSKIDNEPDIPRKSKKLEVSSFKSENRKAEKNKELANKLNTTVPPHTNDRDEVVLYRLRSDEGKTCILLQVDAILSFKYMTLLNEEQESDIFVPSSATIKGDCSDEDKQTLSLRWKTFVLIWNFAKTPGGDRWFVPKIELKFDSTDPLFEHIKNPGKSYVLSSSTSHSNLLFPTPVGKSYNCEREILIELSSSQTKTVATLYTRNLKLQPFIFKNDDFGADYICSAPGSGNYRSETAPLIVGSMLAATCLLTISGYAIYRYFNIEKVQYDTME